MPLCHLVDDIQVLTLKHLHHPLQKKHCCWHLLKHLCVTFHILSNGNQFILANETTIIHICGYQYVNYLTPAGTEWPSLEPDKYYSPYSIFHSILLFYLDITYNNLILIYNVVQRRDDETNNILCTTRHTGHTWQEL